MTLDRKPNAFVVGAPKCGTTTLIEVLGRCQEVFVSNPKELNYFSAQNLLDQGLYYSDLKINSLNDYLRVFDKAMASQKVIVDGSVSYLYYSGVAESIFNFNSVAKIVIMLRDPVDRAKSHYQMDKRLGLVKASLKSIFYSREEYPLHFQQYFELGLYADQISRYTQVFPKEQVLVLSLSLLKSDERRFFEAISSFLGVSLNQGMSSIRKNEMKTPKNSFVSFLYKKAILRRIVGNIIPAPIRNFLNKLLFSKRNCVDEVDDSFESDLIQFYDKDQRMLQKMYQDRLFSFVANP